MRKKFLAMLCSIMCIAISMFCFTIFTPKQASAAELKNLATDSSAISINTKAVDGSVVIGENGVTITNWNNTSEGNPTSAIFVNNKVNSGDVVTATVNTFSASTTSGRLFLQMRFTQTCVDENIWHFTGKNAGKFICMDFQRGWLELTTRENASYTVISTPASGNGGKNGELYGGYDIFDNQNHVITMSKVDTASGISLTIAVDGVAYVQDFAIDDTGLQGSYYFAMGMATWGTETPTAGEHLDISSLTVTGVCEEEKPAQPLANLATDSNTLVVNTGAPENSVSVGENGVSITNWNTLNNGTAGIYYKDKISAEATTTIKMSGYAVDGNSGRFVLQMRYTQTVPDKSLYTWDSGNNAGKVICMEFKPTWLELTLKDNCTYNSTTLATGTVGEGLLYGAYNVLDGNEHVISIGKVDTATGISLTITVDGTPYVKDFAIDDISLQGSYYISAGMQAWGEVTPTAGEYLNISSLTVTGVYEEEKPAQPLANLATDSNALVVNTGAPENSVSVGENGVSITNWNTLNNGTAGIYYKDKISAEATTTIKMSGYAVDDTSGRFVLQMRYTQTVPDKSLYTWDSGNNAGKVICMEFKPTWLELTLKDNCTYNSTTLATGTVGEGLLYGAYNVLDGNEHVISIGKVDTATGISLTITVDGTPYVKDFAIDDISLHGSYYISAGMQAWGEVTPTAGEYLNISSLTVTGIYEEEKPEILEFENLVFADATVEYDGQAHSLVLIGAPEGATVEYDKVNLVENGVYVITATVSKAGYKTVTLTATLTIKVPELKDFTGITFEGATVTYDGNAHNLALVGAPEDATVTYDKFDLVNAGEYTIIATVNMEGYNSASYTAVLTILEAEFTGLVFEDKTVTYDGNYYSITLEGAPEDATVTYSENSYFEVGDYEISVTVSMANYKTVTLTAILSIEYPEVPTLDESYENVAINGENFESARVQNSSNSLIVDENGVTLSDFAYNHSASAFLNKYIMADSTVSFTFNANGEFTADQLADKENYPDNGVVRLGIALMKSDDLYRHSFDYYHNSGSVGKEILLEFSATGWTTLKAYTLGKYESEMAESEKKVLADGNGNGPWYAGTKLFDGQDHVVTIVTKDTETGMIISVAVDGQWYVYEGVLEGEEYKGEYYFAVGLGFNWTVNGNSAESQYANIKTIRVSDFVPVPERPNYEEIYDDAYNLATNKYNFAYDENIMSMTENGLSLNNIVNGVGNGFAITNGKVNEFDWAIKFNLDLYSNWDATDRPEDYSNIYDYSMLKFGFMIDSGLVPTGLSSSFKNMYYGFSIGKDYRAIPGSYEDRSCFLTFARYRGFSDSGQMDSYVNYKFGYNLVDGNDHWIVLKVRNVDDENGKGISMELWLDGVCEITLVDYNTIKEHQGVEYDWDVYGRKGYLAMSTGSNNSEAMAQNSKCLFKEMYVVSYDDVAEGAYMEQAEEPDFQILRNYEFTADEVYYINEQIRLNLINAFIYEGDKAITFTVVNNATGEAIGEVVGGQWVYEPTVEEFLKIKIVANSEDGKTQFNIIDINIEELDVPTTPTDSSSDSTTSESKNTGCFSGIGASGIIACLMAIGIANVFFKKRKD